MADTLCGLPDRDDALVTYLYDDMDTAARATFDAHLAICARCRNDVNELRGVREHLAQWAPPSTSVQARSLERGARLQPDLHAARKSSWRDIPGWAQVAAAMLFLGVSAGIANLDVHYGAQGLTIRTGWSKPSTTAVAQDVSPANRANSAAPANTAPWRADLTALEQQLRGEMRATSGPSAAVPVSASGLTDAEVMRRVRTLVEASEKRQQNELALRTVELMNSVRAQRNVDLQRIDTALGTLQDKTDTRLMKQNATLNYLVSSKQRQ
jgi:hypothetical protein